MFILLVRFYVTMMTNPGLCGVEGSTVSFANKLFFNMDLICHCLHRKTQIFQNVFLL